MKVLDGTVPHVYGKERLKLQKADACYDGNCCVE
jgi:hypothetical protein